MLTKQEIFKSRGYNVPTYIVDADGKQIEIETSENEEQSLAYDRIVAALVNAGYFRARIKEINPFDVIVGGMTWCLDSSSIDLDVDFLFREDLNTGQKIALTEKVVIALPKIKCPYVIEPHQIQGLDFTHIFPVIDWLLKWSHEIRQSKAKYLQSYALNQFYKRFVDKSHGLVRQNEDARSRIVNSILSQYQPRRVCKQSDSNIKNLESRVERTLAEYGMSQMHPISGYPLVINWGRSFESVDVQKVFEKFMQGDHLLAKLNFQNAEALLGANFQEINTERKLRKLKIELDNLKKQKNELELNLQTIVRESEEMTMKSEEKTIEIENFTEEEKKTVKQFQSMIQTLEKLKEKEKKFKEACKLELNDLNQEISFLESMSVDEETEILRLQVVQLKSNLEDNKLELGRKMRTVLSLERQLDQIPSRAELSQYQKRFLELHNQMAAIHTETKRYFILFNSLNDKFHYMEKEYNLLNSIHESYSQVTSSGNGGKDEFLRQLYGIVAGINQAKERVIDKRNQNRKMRDGLNDYLAYLQKLKGDYAAAVKDLSETYKLNVQFEKRLRKLKLEAGVVDE